MWKWVFYFSFNSWGVGLSIWFDTPTSGWVSAQLGPANVMLSRAAR